MDERREMTLWEHLEDLRRALVVCAVTLVVTTGIVYGFFREELYNWVTFPLQEYKVPLVFIGLGEAFTTQIKLALAAGFILALPIILWQVWSFVVPALKPEEKRLTYVIVPLSLALFFTGVLFAYFGVFRFAARFLIMVAGPCVQPMISIGQYVSFLITFVIPFGLAFELPLIIYFLARWGLVSGEWLAKNRKLAILAIFVTSAALTPGPDVISQLLMAGPLLALYEISILVARVTSRPQRATKAGQG